MFMKSAFAGTSEGFPNKRPANTSDASALLRPVIKLDGLNATSTCCAPLARQSASGRFRLKVNDRDRKLGQRRAGLLFFLQRGLKELHCLTYSQLAGPGLQVP